MKTVLFDLDGTLLDTAPDLAFALNQLRAERQLPTLAFDKIRPLVSHGGAALIRGGLDMNETDPEFEPCRQRLLDIYQDNLINKTRLFQDMDKVLNALENAQIKWGVVTNKPARFTLPIMRGLQLDSRASSIVCGDTLNRNKPHPDPILLACQQSDSTHTECVYIGDAQRDIEAGRNANMPTLVALFGYLDKDDQPDTWQADGMLNTPLDILDWLQIKA
ncbi:MAG: HAD-IA family hydrolase [Gammaproteobacteria bacterium]|nr:HAD-IA family hydrolase [Gammaproteobacteria bacterium]